MIKYDVWEDYKDWGYVTRDEIIYEQWYKTYVIILCGRIIFFRREYNKG